jgi:GSH-dependent disulfide-bond oxidoreductase
MMTVYAFSTPNSIRVPIALEELQLEYEIRPVNVRKGEQKLPDFLALNPNGKVPVLLDSEGPAGEPFTLTESGAILIYLAEKTGRLLPADPGGRARVFEQLFFQGTGIGPAFGQAGFFKRQAPERVPIAIDRFHAEAERTLAVLDSVLARRRYAAGELYTIADIAHYGWLWRREFAGVDFAKNPHVARWYDNVSARPAVSRAIARVTALVPPA